MLSGLLTFFAFADLGVGNSVLNRINVAHARDDGVEIRRVTVAGYMCTAAMGFVVVCLWLSWVNVSEVPTSVVGDVPPDQRPQVLAALHVFVLLLAINIPASLVQKSQLGMQSGHWVGLTQFAAAVGMLVSVPAVRVLGGGLMSFVLASLGVQVAANLANGLLWGRHLARARARKSEMRRGASLDWRVVVSLLRTGSHFLVLQVAMAFGFQSDAIVIVHLLGQEAYGDFAVVQRVFLAASSLLLAGLAGLWPAIGEALTSGAAAWVRRTLLRSYALVLIASSSTSLALALLMPHILSRWVGIHSPPPLGLLVVLVLWTTVEALGNVSGAFLNAAKLLRVQVIIATLMSCLSFTAKWFLVGILGAWGAVLATLLAYSITSVPMQVLIIRRYIKKSVN